MLRLLHVQPLEQRKPQRIRLLYRHWIDRLVPTRMLQGPLAITLQVPQAPIRQALAIVVTPARSAISKRELVPSPATSF